MSNKKKLLCKIFLLSLFIGIPWPNCTFLLCHKAHLAWQGRSLNKSFSMSNSGKQSYRNIYCFAYLICAYPCHVSCSVCYVIEHMPVTTLLPVVPWRVTYVVVYELDFLFFNNWLVIHCVNFLFSIRCTFWEMVSCSSFATECKKIVIHSCPLYILNKMYNCFKTCFGMLMPSSV